MNRLNTQDYILREICKCGWMRKTALNCGNFNSPEFGGIKSLQNLCSLFFQNRHLMYCNCSWLFEHLLVIPIHWNLLNCLQKTFNLFVKCKVSLICNKMTAFHNRQFCTRYIFRNFLCMGFLNHIISSADYERGGSYS